MFPEKKDKPEFAQHTYTDHVVAYIKQSILDGTYEPGTKVKELVIARKLSISRAPIREALQILIQEGLVIWIPQKGKFITNLNADQIRNSYFTGGILEGAAVAQAMDLYTEKDFKQLEGVAARMLDIAESGKSVKKFAPLDNKFHKILFSRVDNDFVKEFCKRSCQGLSKFLFYKYWINLFTPHEVYQRHQIIVDVLRDKDADKIEKTIRQHYIDAGEKMYQIKKEEAE